MTELVSETDRQVGRLIQEMRRHRKLDALTCAVGDALRSVMHLLIMSVTHLD